MNFSIAKLPNKIIKLSVAFVLMIALDANAVEWPGEVQLAVNITFDLDAETLWWDNPDTMAGNPSSLSQGNYGPTVAVPKILALLSKHNVRATFFIPSWVAEEYPDTVLAMVADGHEIAAHGVKHIPPVQLTPSEELNVFAESIRVLTDISGKKPLGYRAPAWAFSDVTLKMAAEHGFIYSSNMMNSDVPYVHAEPAGLVELLVSWILDDAPYFWFDEGSWNKKIHSAASVKEIWQEEFSAAYEARGYLDLTMHPQIIGRPARLKMLDDYITWMKGFENVWFATCSEVAEHMQQIHD